MNLTKKRIENLGCVLGLDCSRYQKDINWKKAKASGIEFAFVKVTEGTTVKEAYDIKNRVLEAQKNGVKVGYYHFARPGNVDDPEADAREEAGNVIATISLLPKVKLPIVLDLEAYSTTVVWDNKVDHMNKYVATFIAEMKKYAKNVTVIVYSYKSFIDSNTTPIFGSNPLWIAAYPNNPETTLPSIPKGWSEWKIWQFTSKGTIDGYAGDIDLNVMKKDFFNSF